MPISQTDACYITDHRIWILSRILEWGTCYIWCQWLILLHNFYLPWN